MKLSHALFMVVFFLEGVSVLACSQSTVVPRPTSAVQALSATPAPTATPGYTSTPGPTLRAGAPTQQAVPVKAAPTRVPHAESSVIIINGAYTYLRMDVETANDGSGIAFYRSYNSGDNRITPLGKGWTHSYNMRITLPSEGSKDLQVVDQTGHTELHKLRPDGSYDSRPFADETLVKNADGSHKVTKGDGTIWEFDSGGKLIRITDPQNKVASLTYNSQGKLAAISDPMGRGSITLTYDPKGEHLISVRDWMDPPREVRYSYDSLGRLASVTDRENQTTRYEYHGEGFKLASIVDALGHRALTIEYDDQSRVTKRWDARGLVTKQAIEMSYKINADGSRVTTHTYPPSGFDPTWRTAIINRFTPDGLPSTTETKPSSFDEPLIEETTFDVAGGNSRVTKRGGGTPPPKGVLDPSGQLDGSLMQLWALMDPSAMVQAVIRTMSVGDKLTTDAFGRTTVWIAPADQFPGLGEAERTIKVGYDAEDRVTSVEMPNPSGGNALMTKFRYDAVGNLIEVIDPISGTTQYEYDERDSVKEARLSNGGTVKFEYDDRGNVARARVVTAPSAREQVSEWLYDGLRRLRKVTQYPRWPDKSYSIVTECAYDENGRTGTYVLRP